VVGKFIINYPNSAYLWANIFPMRLVEGLKDIISLLHQDFINLIHIFDPINTKTEKGDLARRLKTNGIVVIPEFFTSQECDQIRDQLEALVQKHRETVELDDGTLIHHRGQKDNGVDSGMIDVFKADHAIPQLKPLKEDSFIQEVLEHATGQKVIPFRINAYINQGVENTRGYHIDNAQPVTYKSLIYLTDVFDEKCGPYSFIPKSHRFNFKTYLNLIRNTFVKTRALTDMHFYPKKDSFHALAPKGTLIISNQNGMHRGLPQSPDSKRMVVVINHLILSKLSYVHKQIRNQLVNP